MMSLEQKRQKLEKGLRELGSVAVAFSAGVDSTFLLKMAHDVLGDHVIAVTAQSCFFPARERNEADIFCEKEGIRHIVIGPEELPIDGFRHNPKNRCYLCKRALFIKIGEAAGAHGIANVAEGSNLDDLGDYRPGLQAIAELGVKSPLRDAELTKADIRALSRELGLPTWDKPSFACLASRFVYGEEITDDKLRMVECAEQWLFDQGFHQVRVRIHGKTARIELKQEETTRLFADGRAEQANAYMKGLGFDYVTLDLGGYQMGSMNQTLDQEAD